MSPTQLPTLRAAGQPILAAVHLEGLRPAAAPHPVSGLPPIWVLNCCCACHAAEAGVRQTGAKPPLLQRIALLSLAVHLAHRPNLPTLQHDGTHRRGARAHRRPWPELDARPLLGRHCRRVGGLACSARLAALVAGIIQRPVAWPAQRRGPSSLRKGGSVHHGLVHVVPFGCFHRISGAAASLCTNSSLGASLYTNPLPLLVFAGSSGAAARSTSSLWLCSSWRRSPCC